MISVHVEADPHPHQLLGEIRAAGCLAGLAINPGTPLESVGPLLERVDYVNCMGVNPGFSGQSFIPETLGRLAALRDLLPDRVALQVDGGIGPANAADARAYGADLVVSASAIFGAEDPVASYRDLVERVGTLTAQVRVDSAASETVLKQSEDNRDSLSAVNLDEEAAKLVQFQQYYGASAQVIKIAQSLFDTLIGAFR